MAEKTNDEKSSPVEQQRLEQEQIEDLAASGAPGANTPSTA